MKSESKQFECYHIWTCICCPAEWTEKLTENGIIDPIGESKHLYKVTGLQEATLTPSDEEVRLGSGNKYCAHHVLVQSDIRRYNFYFLSDHAQTHLDHFNVLDDLWCKISFTGKEFLHRLPL